MTTHGSPATVWLAAPHAWHRARRSAQAVTPEQPVQVLAVVASGACRGRDVAVVAREQVLEERLLALGRPLLARSAQVVGGRRLARVDERRPLGHRDAALDVVPQLAHVAGPWMARELGLP